MAIYDAKKIKGMTYQALQALAKKHKIPANWKADDIRARLFKELKIVDPDIPLPNTDTSFNVWESASHSGTPIRVRRPPPSPSAHAGPSHEGGISHTPPLPHLHPILPIDDSDATARQPPNSENEPGTTALEPPKLLPTFHLRPMPKLNPAHATTDPRPAAQARVLHPSLAGSLPEGPRAPVFTLPAAPARTAAASTSNLPPVPTFDADDETQRQGLAYNFPPTTFHPSLLTQPLIPVIPLQEDSDFPSPTSAWSNRSLGQRDISTSPPAHTPQLEQPEWADWAEAVAAEEEPEDTEPMLIFSRYARGYTTIEEYDRAMLIFDALKEQNDGIARKLEKFEEKVSDLRKKDWEYGMSRRQELSRVERLYKLFVDFKNIEPVWTDKHMYGLTVLAKPDGNGGIEELYSDIEGHDDEDAVEMPAYVVHNVQLEERDLKRPRPDDDDEEEESASTRKRPRFRAPEPEPLVQFQDEDEDEDEDEDDYKGEYDTSGPLLSPPLTPSRKLKAMPPPQSLGRREALEEEEEVVDILSAPIRDSSMPLLSPLVRAPSPPPRRRNTRTRTAALLAVPPEPSTPPRLLRGVNKGKRRAN